MKRIVFAAACLCLVFGGIFFELKTSFLQSWVATQLVQNVSYHLEGGKALDTAYPKHGPLNERFGYTRLPEWLKQLNGSYEIKEQAELSIFHKRLVDQGINPLYRIKSTAGLQLLDTTGKSIYDTRPALAFNSYSDIPPLLVEMLLFIENKELLNDSPYYNPAIEFDRLAKVLFEYLLKRMTLNEEKQAGGSTLATQMEKYNFSEDGKTNGAMDKIMQISSATLRSYISGRDTSEVRKNIVLDYLNTIPLGAAPRYGEVLGYGEALRVFYLTDTAEEKEVLKGLKYNTPYTDRQLEAIDRAIQIIISARNPNYLSLHSTDKMLELKARYIQLLVDARVLRPQAYSLANQFFKKKDYVGPEKNFVGAKGLDLLRKRLSSLLEVPLPELDKLDLTAQGTLKQDMQSAVASFFANLTNEEFIQENGLRVERLLDQTAADRVTYSFVLYELKGDQALMRATYDNLNKPFNFNDSGKLELGSTAKMRVMVSYLEAVTQAYREKEQGALTSTDPVSRFVAETEGTLNEVLLESLQREYSANPNQVFFTGGGSHRFQNFNKDDNKRKVSLHEAFIKSINLPFVRCLQEVVRFHIHRNENYRKLRLGDEGVRKELLGSFIEKESKLFLHKFYKNLSARKDLERYVSLDLPRTIVGSAVVVSYLHPDYTVQQVLNYLTTNGYELTTKQTEVISRVVSRHKTGVYDINDLGYIARLHPILLYTAKSLIETPDITYSQLVTQSYRVRKQSYKWLLSKKRKSSQMHRIYTVLEAQGFEVILEQWQTLGFPFEYIVPSLATALGSSGDKPRALARLIGIVRNDGINLDESLIENLSFAKGTPYEVTLNRLHKPQERVMTKEVSALVSSLLHDVVDKGTAIRVRDTFKPMMVGGKTGTGDNELKEVTSNGTVVDSTPLSRTATFVFYVGDYFGSLTVFVEQDQAANSTFTSSYPVTLFKLLSEHLKPLM